MGWRAAKLQGWEGDLGVMAPTGTFCRGCPVLNIKAISSVFRVTSGVERRGCPLGVHMGLQWLNRVSLCFPWARSLGELYRVLSVWSESVQ